jgi:hypothetical protein
LNARKKAVSCLIASFKVWGPGFLCSSACSSSEVATNRGVRIGDIRWLPRAVRSYLRSWFVNEGHNGAIWSSVHSTSLS